MEIKEYYNGIAKKSGLASFEDFDSEFDISDIKEGNFSKRISECIIEKISKYRKLLEEFIQPDGNSLAAMIETKSMTEKEMNKVNDAYKELMILERSGLICELENNEVEFIKKATLKWKELKPVLKEIVIKAKDSWTSDFKIKEELGYLG